MISGLPFDDIRQLAASLSGADEDARAEAAAVNRKAAERDGPAGKAGEIAEWLAAWSGRRPGALKPQIAIFAATHALSARMEPDDAESVQAFVDRCGAGGAAVNQLCAAGDYGLKVFDLALDIPVEDFIREAALDERGCAATMAFGMEALAGASGLVVLAGHGGSAGQHSALSVLGALRLLPAARESAFVRDALACHAGHLSDPLEAMRRLGGREIAALAGAIVAARTQRVPVLLDGVAALAAVAVLHALNAEAVSHCMLADGGGLAGEIAEALELKSVMDLGMGNADASAGAIAAGVVQASAYIHAAAGRAFQPG